MQVFSIEVFRQDKMVAHGYTTELEYTFDYLSPEKNKVNFYTTDDNSVQISDVVYIHNKVRNIVGIVTKLTDIKGGVELTYQSPLALLNKDVFFDTNWQRSRNLVDLLISYMRDLFVPDIYPYFAGVEFSTPDGKGDNDWGFNLKSDVEDAHRCVINLWTVLIVRSMLEYGWYVNLDYNPNSHVLNVVIRRNSLTARTIETFLPNIVDTKFSFKTSEFSNKITMYSTRDEDSPLTFYVLADGSFTDNANDPKRVHPVRPLVKLVDMKDKTDWAGTAKSEARSTIRVETYDNNIEVEMLATDILYDPLNIPFGQLFNIYKTRDVNYVSVLTGFVLKDTVTLTFGIARDELTKKLMKGGK